MLHLQGHEVGKALDGSSALDPAEEFEPNAALLDIGMPALNGYELARELRSSRNGRGLLLMAATGYGQLENRGGAKAAGFDFHMVKPPDPQTVAAEIAKGARERER